MTKYSIETTLPSINEILKSAHVDNFQHRGRLTFIKKDFPFKIDVSVRYLGLEDVDIETTKERLNSFVLDETDIIKPKKISGLDMKFDVEFESLNSYSNKAMDDFNKCFEFITGFDSKSFDIIMSNIQKYLATKICIFIEHNTSYDYRNFTRLTLHDGKLYYD